MHPGEGPENNKNHSGTKVSTSLSSDISIPGSDFEILGDKEIKPARILGESMMMITYRWELEDLEKDHKTISSRMICFRGEKVFRVGLKNRDKPTLIFMAIDLNKVGMRVREVGFDKENSDSRQKMTHNNVDGESLQLFTFDLTEMVVGNYTFVFSIWLEGSVPGCFSYQLADRLAKRDLWNASTKSQHYVDVEFVCKADKKFSAHKAILAARSPVFAAEFEELAKKYKFKTTDDGPLQIHIDDVDPTAVERFLYFLYTGEAIKLSLANEDLLKLAKRYELDTLVELCQIALKKVDVMQMASFVSNLDLDPESPPFIVRPDKDTELSFGHHESTYRCVWVFEGRKAAERPLAIDYQNENLFSLHLKDEIIHFICVNHRKFVNQVIYSTNSKNWIRMKPKNAKHKLEKSEMLFFVAKSDVDFDHSSEQSIHFDVKMISTIGDYRYEMMDVSWLTDFWKAAEDGQLTDVDVYVGQKKLMEAHQVILSARSPVLSNLLSNMTKNGKATITFEADIDPSIVKHFLYFLYTGSSKINFSNKQYLALAEIHEVETLSKICNLAIVSSPDVDEVTNFLLANF